MAGGFAQGAENQRCVAPTSIVPTSRRRTVRVGMPPWTLCVRCKVTRSVTGCIPTQSVGTIRSGIYRVKVNRLTSAPGNNADEVLRWL